MSARHLRRRTGLLATAAALVLAGGGCRLAPPALPAPAHPPPELAVVLVPGTTGVELRDARSGEIAWGRGRNLLVPRDRGYALALGLDGTSRLVAGAVLEQVRLAGPIRKPIYGPLLARLEGLGYRRGELTAPRPDDRLFAFAYDWRRSNLESARLLAEGLAALRRASGQRRLPVALLCQSNGSHICRWLAKHGGADLASAERGEARPLPGLDITDLVLLGGANGGSLRILRELDRGRRYLPAGRRWAPEVFFTFRSLFEELPAADADLFVDAAGAPLDVDLFAAASWERYGWSAFGSAATARLGRLGARRDRALAPQALGSADARRDYLTGALDEARRFHRRLDADVEGFRARRLHVIGSFDLPTPRRAVLAQCSGGWRTLFTGDPAVDRDPRLSAVATATGDGHATSASQLALSPQELDALAGRVHRVGGRHFEMILEPDTLSILEQILARARAEAAG